MNLYWIKFKFPMQKLAIFRKVKSKIPDFDREKSRNYASRFWWEQVIPKIDTDIAEKGYFWMERK